MDMNEDTKHMLGRDPIRSSGHIGGLKHDLKTQFLLENIEFIASRKLR